MEGLEVISLLEEKIDSLLAYIKELEDEKRLLSERLKQSDEEIGGLNQELDRLKKERAEIGQRVENILGRISSLGDGQGAVAELQAREGEDRAAQRGFEFVDAG